ncbi:MAG: hypothetical protein BWK75_00230 [Candidatus Altiarchaeales archaeon A3]|nr:MAG: hypothetical protein BWK75_00230 [Candidatus Altiarchaeales archaeon A3]
MTKFSSIRELFSAFYKEQELLDEMFKKRKLPSYKYEYALELVDNQNSRIQYLIDRSVISENSNFIEIDDLFLQFFEQVLEVNEDINTSYINENIQNVKQNISYYFDESNEQRKYNYLRIIKNTLKKIGIVTLRNIIDLKRNVETTFKNESNYKIKRSKLENLDKKREYIKSLIDQTRKLISEDERTFFKSALDEELNQIIIQIKNQLSKSTHNLIEIEKQIINFLNQIEYQNKIAEKLRQIKYLKDQFILETSTNYKSVLSQNNSVIFEPNPSYPLNLSLEYLQTDEDAFASIKKVAKHIVNKVVNLKWPIADKIASEYLENQTEEEIQINLEEIKNGFVASSYNLFEFILNYHFPREPSFDEQITIFCQLISQYEDIFKITDEYKIKKGIEYVIVYAK